MPRVPLAPENKSKSSYDFPKFTLDQGQRARVCLMDPVPETQYVHTMRSLQVVNGRVQTREVTDSKGNVREEPEYDFVGRHICLGSFDVIADKGLDKDGCPVCLESTRSDAVKPPERRHALNLFVYQTEPGSFTVSDPFQGSVKVWNFTDSRQSALIDLAGEWGDLRKKDLNFGPCTNKQWQKFDIQPAAECVWLKNEANQQLAAQIFKNGELDDLTVALGRKLSREQVLDDLAKVLEKYEQAYGRRGGQAITPAEASEQIDVGGILAETGTEATPVADVPITDEKAEPEKDAAILDLDEILKM